MAAQTQVLMCNCLQRVEGVQMLKRDQGKNKATQHGWVTVSKLMQTALNSKRLQGFAQPDPVALERW